MTIRPNNTIPLTADEAINFLVENTDISPLQASELINFLGAIGKIFLKKQEIQNRREMNRTSLT